MVLIYNIAKSIIHTASFCRVEGEQIECKPLLSTSCEPSCESAVCDNQQSFLRSLHAITMPRACNAMNRMCPVSAIATTLSSSYLLL